MAFANFGNPYQPDPQSDDYQDAGGLPGLLREAMQRQALQGDGTGAAATSTASSYGNPQGLFGRLLELQRNQGIPIGIDQGDATSGVSSLLTPVQYSVRVGPGISVPFPETDPRKIQQIPMPPEPWPTIGKVLWSGLTRQPLGGQGPNHQDENTSTSSLGPQTPVRTATPAILEPFSTIAKIVQALPGLARGLASGDDENYPNDQTQEDTSTEGARKRPKKPSDPKPPLPFVPGPPLAPDGTENNGYGGGGGSSGGGGSGDGSGPSKEECDQQWQSAKDDCSDFMAGDKGREYGGPYGKRRGEPFDYDKCVRGLVSEECGGEAKTWDPKKKKR